jgi:acetolactate synthase I/II/III large subunit
VPDAAASVAGAGKAPSVAAFVGRAVAAFGATRAFGVVGSGNFAVTGALRAAGVGFVAARHEGGAIVMADAYSRMGGGVGVVTVHQGCGLTNTATGLGEAAKSRTPLLLIAAAAPAGDPHNNFAMDQPGFAASVGAASLTIEAPERAAAVVFEAWELALAGHAVLLNLPIDVQGRAVSAADASLLAEWEAVAGAATVGAPAGAAEAGETGGTAAALPAAPPAVVPSREGIAELVRALGAAERPVIIAGRGARGAGPVLRELAAEAGALLATSAVAKGLFSRDPFDLGISGGFATDLAAELIRGADVVVAFGCALNDWTTRRGTLLGPGVTLVQVDRDAAALGKHRPVSAAVLGDVGLVAEAALEELAYLRSGLDAEPGGRYRSEAVAARIAAEGTWNRTPTPDLGGSGRIDPRVLSDVLNDVVPAARVVSTDSGNFMGYPAQYLSVPDERGFCFTQAFQSIGLGLGTAIGAALAQPERLPILGTGDGGFLMGIADLETAVRLQLPLLVVVYDDAAYGAEVHHFGPADPEADLSDVVFPERDLAALAAGFGARSAVVRSVADLEVVEDWLASVRSGVRVPLVLDAKVASDGGAWWLQEAFARH